jgi:ribonucleoside-triphosphate reductase
MNQYQHFIALSRYARYRDDLGRRETWEETVARYCDFWKEKYGDLFPYDSVNSSIRDLHVMPSMRALMSAGPALERDNMAGYNCSYIAVDHVRAFDEAMYILMCGTGVGFSVERQFVAKLPEVPDELFIVRTQLSTSRTLRLGGHRRFVNCSACSMPESPPMGPQQNSPCWCKA